jgi:tetratricopeptide (TPR) repeat protein
MIGPRNSFPFLHGLEGWAALWGSLLVLGLLFGCAGQAPRPGETPAALAQKRQLAAYHYGLAQEFWERDRQDLAMRYLEMAVRQDPLSDKPRLKILDIYLVSGEGDAALNYLKTCPKAMLMKPAFLKRRALALELEGRADEAGPIWEEAVQEADQDPGLLLAKVENDLLQGRKKEALVKLQEGHEIYPDNTALLLSLSALCRAFSLHREEGDFLIKLARLEPENPEHLRKAARAFIRAGCIDDGIAGISWCAAETGFYLDGAANASLGYLHYRRGDFAMARECFERAFVHHGLVPDHDELLAFAEIQMREAHYTKAADLLLEALKMKPDHALTRAALCWAYHCSGKEGLSREVIAQAPEGTTRERILEAVKNRLERDGNEDPSF